MKTNEKHYNKLFNSKLKWPLIEQIEKLIMFQFATFKSIQTRKTC